MTDELRRMRGRWIGPSGCGAVCFPYRFLFTSTLNTFHHYLFASSVALALPPGM